MWKCSLKPPSDGSKDGVRSNYQMLWGLHLIPRWLQLPSCQPPSLCAKYITFCLLLYGECTTGSSKLLDVFGFVIPGPHRFNLCPPHIRIKLKCDAVGKSFLLYFCYLLVGSLKILIYVLMQLTVTGHKSKKDQRKPVSGVF